jgi:hypothetical protein
MKQLISLILFSIIFVDSSFAEERIEFGRKWAEEYALKISKGEVKNYKPKSGYVPNKEVAISIALSVWEPIYGKEKIAKQAPYFAYLVGDIWVVTGSLPKGSVGGTAKAVISKDTGEVKHIIHHK